MYDGFIQLGTDELANVARFKTYIEGSTFPWVKNIPQAEADALRNAIGDAPYTNPVDDDAPWYDPGDPASANFYGLYVTGIQGDEDDPRDATFTQSIGDGGTVGPVRRATRQMRVKAVLAARDEFAMESGLRWLRRTIDPDDCPGGDCGTMTLCAYAGSPGYIDGCGPYDYPAQIGRTNEVLDPTIQNKVATHWRPLNGGSLGATGFGAIYSAPAVIASGSEILSGDATMLAASTLARSGGMVIKNLSTAAISFRLGMRGVTNGVADTSFVFGPVVAIPAGATQRVTFTAQQLLAKNTGYTVSLVLASAMPAAAAIQLSEPIIEAANTVGSFFSGAGVTTDAAAYLWLGRAYDSASRLFTSGVDPQRHLNGVTAISGPTINNRRSWPGGVLREVEFGLESQTPYFFTTARRVLDSSSVIAGAATYFDQGTLLSVNHVFDPRGITAGTRSLIATGAAAGSITYNIGSGASAGFPRNAQGHQEGLKVTVTTAGTALTIQPAAPIASFYKGVTPGNRYIASVYIVSSAALQAQIGINWYNAAGSVISTSLGTPLPTPGPPGVNGFKQYSVAATAPAGAAYGGIIVGMTGAGGTALAVGNYFNLNWWQFELARIIDGQVSDTPSEWFDGDVVRERPDGDTNFNVNYDVTQSVAWEGAAHASASYRFRDAMCDWTFVDGKWTKQTTAVLQDPLNGSLPTPPAPPVISPNIPDPGLKGWVRSAYPIPAMASSENGIAVPTIGLSVPTVAGAPTTVRQVRIRFYGNPAGVAPSAINQCDFCSEITLSYVQVGTTFVIDGETQSVSAIIAGQTYSADGYAYGPGGGPVEWPELDCGIPYVVTIDQPRSTTVAATPIAVTVDMTQRM